MKLKEALQSFQAKQEYRELAKKYHTDIADGNNDIMIDINNAKDQGDESLHKLYKKLMNKLKEPHAPIFNGTDKKQIEEWMKEIESHYPGLFYTIMTDENGGVYIKLSYRKGSEIVQKFVMNAQIAKTQSDLAKKVKESLLK